MVEIQFGVPIKTIRTDNGYEFSSQEYTTMLTNKGIIYKKKKNLIPYTPQQNGIVSKAQTHS